MGFGPISLGSSPGRDAVLKERLIMKPIMNDPKAIQWLEDRYEKLEKQIQHEEKTYFRSRGRAAEYVVNNDSDWSLVYVRPMFELLEGLKSYTEGLESK